MGQQEPGACQLLHSPPPQPAPGVQTSYAASQKRRSQAFGIVSSASEKATSVLGLTTPSESILPEIDFKVTDSPPLEFSGDLLLLGLLDSAAKRDEDGKFLELLDPAVVALDETLGGILKDLVAEPEFQGKPGQVSSATRVLGFPFKRLAVVGLAKPDSLATPEPAAWKPVGAAVANLSKKLGAESVALAIIPSPPQEDKPSSEEDKTGSVADEAPEETSASRGRALGLVAQGVVLGSFQDTRFKSEKEKEKARAATHVKAVTFIVSGVAEAKEALFKAVRIAAGTMLAKELVTAPPNVLTPATMAQVAEGLSAFHSDVLEAKILSEEECRQLGMGAYLAVAAASSENRPRFIHLTYTPPGADPEQLTKLAIIGKGLTFDSGGYNLKAGAGSMIELMKFDMGGAAATLGAAKAVAAIQPKGVQVHFIVAACENMVSGSGLRPGDIITASNGKTIEVNNTDAEGRLTLADALVYANKLKVHKIVDLATLTGACIVALGRDISGLFSPSDALATELAEASKASGEKLWRMPLEDSYFEGLKSSTADMVNTGPREGGSITAALFLKQYVDKDIPWAHIDMAGPVWDYKSSQGTGYAANLLYNWVEANSSD